MRDLILCALGMIAAILIVGRMDYDDAVKAESDYCASVKAWRVTGGHAGHPDYKEISKEVCNE